MAGYLAGVDIGGTSMRVTLANQGGIAYKVVQETFKIGPNSIVPRQVRSLVAYATAKTGIKDRDIEGVGISTCSPFRRRGDYRDVVTPNLCGGLARDRENRPPNDWTEIPLERELADFYKWLEIENDCTSGAKAERLFGAAQAAKDFWYVTWSTGIGGGAYSDGRLVRGKNGNAAHIGHIPLIDGGPKCGCGNRGDLESLAAGPAIARDYGVTETKKVFDAYKKGNKKAKRVVQNAAKYFARGLASATMMFDTKLFVIGGAVMLENRGILLPLVGNEYYRWFPALTKGTKIVLSGLGRYLGDLAALSLVMPGEWIAEWDRRKPWKAAPKEVYLEASFREKFSEEFV